MTLKIQRSVSERLKEMASYTKTIQTQNNLTVNAGGTNAGEWIDVSAFHYIGITLASDFASVNQVAQIQWSNDRVLRHGIESFAGIALKEKAYSTTAKAKYARIEVQNGDSASHVINAWIHLKP
jgi:hypothetical protein